MLVLTFCADKFTLNCRFLVSLPMTCFRVCDTSNLKQPLVRLKLRLCRTEKPLQQKSGNTPPVTMETSVILGDVNIKKHCYSEGIFKTFLPFFGRPLPLPSRDFLSSSLLFGLVGTADVPLITSPLSLRESPRPESLEEFFLSLRLAFAFRRASWMLLLDEDSQLPLISLLMFLWAITDPPLFSSPDAKESLRSSASVALWGKQGIAYV